MTGSSWSRWATGETCTVADRANHAPASGLLSSAGGDPTTRSEGYGSLTTTSRDLEQLFVVSDSSDTASTHAP